MPRETRVFSISVVDLLCCALGSMLLICFLLIVSIGQPSRAGFSYEFLTASAMVWVDVTDSVPRDVKVAPAPALDRWLATEGAGLASACEVQLELYCQQGEQTAVPRATSIPRFVANSAESGSVEVPFQAGARMTRRVEQLGLRRLERAKGEQTLLAGYRLDLAAFEVERGWYFFRLAIVKRPPTGKVGGETAAWLRLDSSGRPGATWFQTHETLNLPEWPTPDGFRGLQEELPVLANFRPGAGEKPKQIRERMQRLTLPDLYLPDWPEKYAVRGAGVSLRYAFRTREGAGGDWVPFFALRQLRGTPVPVAARFPVDGGAEQARPGWHQSETDEKNTWDYYLPGLRIGGEMAP